MRNMNMENVFQYSKIVSEHKSVNRKTICVYKLNDPWNLVVSVTRLLSPHCFYDLILNLLFKLSQYTGSIVLHGNPVRCRGLPSKVKCAE
jgi:hypothetical protein